MSEQDKKVVADKAAAEKVAAEKAAREEYERERRGRVAQNENVDAEHRRERDSALQPHGVGGEGVFAQNTLAASKGAGGFEARFLRTVLNYVKKHGDVEDHKAAVGLLTELNELEGKPTSAPHVPTQLPAGRAPRSAEDEPDEHPGGSKTDKGGKSDEPSISGVGVAEYTYAGSTHSFLKDQRPSPQVKYTEESGPAAPSTIKSGSA